MTATIGAKHNTPRTFSGSSFGTVSIHSYPGILAALYASEERIREGKRRGQGGGGTQLARPEGHALDESCEERHRHAVCVGRWGKLWRVDVCMGIHPHHAEAWARLQCATARSSAHQRSEHPRQVEHERREQSRVRPHTTREPGDPAAAASYPRDPIATQWSPPSVSVKWPSVADWYARRPRRWFETPTAVAAACSEHGRVNHHPLTHVRSRSVCTGSWCTHQRRSVGVAIRPLGH